MAKEEKQNYNYLEQEKHWQEFWEKENIYKFDPEKEGEIFSVDTPPPYVSAAHLHAGHVMSYTQAEFVVRYKRMQGYNVFYPMGFDDNGLPTERFVEKKYNLNRSKISKKEFVELCLKETKLGGQTYKDFLNSLGISVDWSLLYSTINPHCQRMAQRSFIDLYQKGLIERRNEPTIWCPACQTALAQSDLDDKEDDSYLVYINFKFDNGEPALIATSRPELLPACVALYTNSQDKRYQKFIGKKAIVPIFNHEVPVLADDRVDPEFGTGLMMVCTWGDTEDIARWKEDKLDTKIAVDKTGRMTEIAGKFAGQKLLEARANVLLELEETGVLVKKEPITHVYNVHERCGTPNEFIITPQWFIKTVENKEAWKKRGDELNWYPRFMKAKYDAWIDGLKWDWCISRQRYHGVPFPLWHCLECGEIILAEDKDLPVDPTQTAAPSKCSKCGSSEIVPEEDVMDTWMTSSLTPLINAHWKYDDKSNLMDKIYPMTVRVQAFEIIRTWLFDTIVKSHYHTDSLPWKDVMISGWGLDAQGRKISKSLGNFIEPEKLISQYSADAMRYWSAGANLGQNLRYNEEEIKVGKKTINKLWNASKFCFMHLEDFKNTSNVIPTNAEESYNSESKDPSTPLGMTNITDIIQLEGADRWILNELQLAIKEYQNGFDRYEYSKAKNAIDKFFWEKFCDNYLEFVKYRIYSEDEELASSKQAAKWTLYKVLLSILKLYAPIMPFITEELYQKYFFGSETDKSIHISRLPQIEKEYLNQESSEQFSKVLEIVNQVRKEKALRNISIKAELDEIVVESTTDLSGYSLFLQSVLSFKKVTFGKAETEISKDLKITIK